MTNIEVIFYTAGILFIIGIILGVIYDYWDLCLVSGGVLVGAGAVHYNSNNIESRKNT